MFVIAGLGNPGREYLTTRHNAGFMAIDALAAKYGIAIDTKKHKGLIGKGMIESEKVILVKPQTYMNLSGECIREVMDFYKLEPEQLLVIYDDIDLDVGHLRIRAKGSAGGHNGMKSIVQHLGSEAFARIRIGVGEKNPHMELADYVLGHFSGEEMKLMQDAFEAAGKAAVLIAQDEMSQAMNLYNTKKVKVKKEKPVKQEKPMQQEKSVQQETPMQQEKPVQQENPVQQD